MRITMLQVEASYDVASQVFDQALPLETGAQILHETHGLNINSARDFINDYRFMLNGKVFHRAMSAPAVDYFLTRIQSERGLKLHKEAISAVRQHIEYYEGIRKVNLHAMRSVVERHDTYSSNPPLARQREVEFNASVLLALKDSPSARHARLLGAAKRPLTTLAVTKVYLRNADVVAEVLIRASGVCEHCEKEAPFIRKKDATPYLEVHHVKQLAQGGEDTVENAIALCPNCHRELHYGISELPIRNDL